MTITLEKIRMVRPVVLESPNPPKFILYVSLFAHSFSCLFHIFYRYLLIKPFIFIGDEPKDEWKRGLCPRTPVLAGLKASEMSAFGPPQGCVS